MVYLDLLTGYTWRQYVDSLLSFPANSSERYPRLGETCNNSKLMMQQRPRTDGAGRGNPMAVSVNGTERGQFNILGGRRLGVSQDQKIA